MPANEKKNEQDQPEAVSAKKVIYIEIDDEVTAIYDKIRRVKAKNVYVVAPKRAILFQSVVNLKILKRKAEDEGKEIFLISNDPNGVHLAQKIGITVYNKANTEGKPALFSTELNDEKLRITPLKATVNEVEEEAPMRLTERKISISEILRRAKKKLNISAISGGEKKKTGQAKPRPKFVIVAPNRHALIGFVAVTLVILLVIVYVALPGATIYITPTASVLEKSMNIVLADAQKNRAELEGHQPNMIASYPLITTVSRTLTHYATGKKISEKAANASGKLTIFNTSNTVWPLVAKTRFQTEEGIVFRTPTAVNVPAASAAGPGKVEAFVIADPVDAYNAIVGERGNVGPSRFFLPGLREDSRSKLYGESAAPMTGGFTDFTTYVMEEDIGAAKARIGDELVKSAVEELKKTVAQKSEESVESKVYVLLEGDKAVKTGEVKVRIDPALEGRPITEFQVSGEVIVSGIYYEREAMLEILKKELLLKKSPQKELLRINEGSTSYRIFEWDDATGKIKVTANIKGIEQYEIDPEKENGARLLEKIRDHIAGKNLEDAKLYIQNLPEINKVEIESWPAWSPTIPNLSDNIEFEIRDAIAVD